MTTGNVYTDVSVIDMFKYFAEYDKDYRFLYSKTRIHKLVNEMYREKYVRGELTIDQILVRVKMSADHVERWNTLAKRCPYFWDWICHDVSTVHHFQMLKMKALNVLEKSLDEGGKDSLKAAELILKHIATVEQVKISPMPFAGIPMANSFNKLTEAELNKKYIEATAHDSDAEDPDRDPLDPPAF